MLKWIKSQWSKKWVFGIAAWIVGTYLATGSMKATFAEWTNFTWGIVTLLFAAHVTDKTMNGDGKTPPAV